MSTELLKATLGKFSDMQAELESLRQERDAALNTFHSANRERLELRQENSRLRADIGNLQVVNRTANEHIGHEADEHDKLVASLNAELKRLRADIKELQGVNDVFVEHDCILKGGTRLNISEAQEALDAAMQIIEAVGTTGIYSRYQKAHEWMKRYYPAWA